MHVPVTLGTFIRERRAELGLSQEQLAERVGERVRQAEISRLEHDRVTLPRRERLEQLAAALEVSVGELFLQTGWMQEGDRLDTELNAATRSFRTSEDLDAIALQNLSSLVDTVAAVQDMVAEAALVLEQAEESIEAMMKSLNIERNTRGIIRPRTGVITEWETAAVFPV